MQNQRFSREMRILHVGHRRIPPSLVIDLVAGAIDARLSPQIEDERLNAAEDANMIVRMKRRCAGCTDLTPRQKALSSALMLGSAAVLVAIWMWVSASYRDPEIRQYILAFVQVPLLAGYILVMPLTILRGRSVRTNAIVMSLSFVALIVWSALIGFIATVF